MAYCTSNTKAGKQCTAPQMGDSDYCYRHNPELKTELERAVLQHQLDTGKKVSTSSVIRTAIEQYLKRGKL